MASWLSVPTHKAKVVSLNPTNVTIKPPFGEEGNGKPPHKIHFPWKKLRALSLVSATLKSSSNPIISSIYMQCKLHQI